MTPYSLRRGSIERRIDVRLENRTVHKGYYVQRIREVLKDARFEHHVGPLEDVCLWVEDGGITFRIVTYVPDVKPPHEAMRVRGEMGFLSMEAVEDAAASGGLREMLADTVRQAVLEALDHELRESLVFGDSRPLDPHDGNPP